MMDFRTKENMAAFEEKQRIKKAGDDAASDWASNKDDVQAEFSSQDSYVAFCVAKAEGLISG